MLVSNSQKIYLIEAMKKLTSYSYPLSSQISNNVERQKEIFYSLSSSDLKKIIQNLYDDNQYLRRASALLLCQLFYNNYQLKNAMTKKLCLPLSHGRVLVSKFRFVQIVFLTQYRNHHQELEVSVPQSRVLIIYEITTSKKQPKTPISDEDKVLCWAINLDKKQPDLQFFQFKKYSSFTFLDPSRTIFGFTIIQPKHQHQIPQSPPTQIIKFSTKQQQKKYHQLDKRYSIFKRIQLSKNHNKNITSRQRQHVSNKKDKVNLYLKNNKQFLITNINNINNTRPISSYASTTTNKKLTTTQQPIQHTNSRHNTTRQQPPTYKPQKQKQKQKFSLSFTNDPHDHHHLGYTTQRILTDTTDLKTKSKNQYSPSKNIHHHKLVQNNQQQNFYKKVQDILKK